MTQGYFSRDEAVAAILSFCHFFATLPSLSPGCIREAPADGWPQITAESLSEINKHDDVVDLLKHLPYIDWTEIAFHTHFIDYSDSQRIEWIFQKGVIEGSLVPSCAGNIPPHVAVIVDGSKYGSWLLLDTQQGAYISGI